MDFLAIFFFVLFISIWIGFSTFGFKKNWPATYALGGGFIISALSFVALGGIYAIFINLLSSSASSSTNVLTTNTDNNLLNGFPEKTWRCQGTADEGGMTLEVRSDGYWRRYLYDLDYTGSGTTDTLVGTYSQDGSVITSTITESNGKPWERKNVFDVDINGKEMKIVYRSTSGKPGATWMCEDREPIMMLYAGSHICSSYNSALKARQIVQANPYVNLPHDCSRLNTNLKTKWNKERQGITSVGIDGNTYYTWDNLIES